MAEPTELGDRARRFALENAVQHGTAPRAGPITSRLLASFPELRRDPAGAAAAAEVATSWVAGLPADARRAELLRLGGSLEAPKSARSDRPEMPELLGAVDGQVVLRMAPFPSGALHVGHARMLFVNDHYRQRYHGKLLLVFDDTVGSEQKRVDGELYNVIQEDLRYVGVTPDAIVYKSDRLPIFYEWAFRVIDAGAAYVCKCPNEQLRENRLLGLACPERGQSIPETRKEWERMLGGEYAVGEAVLRLRTDIQDPDPAFRDRVLFRLSDLDHPRVGRKYRVWPMLEFSWAVDDHLLGITHVIRGKDLQIEDRMEEFLWKVLGLKGPSFIHWGMLRVDEAKLSKSKSYVEVKTGVYDGWADPRTWSLRSLVRRGIGPGALKEFTLPFGLSLADIEVPAETLFAANRVRIDPTSPRRAFIPVPIRVEVEGFPEALKEVELQNHPDQPEMGQRTVRTGPGFFLPGADVERLAGTEVRLKDLANISLGPYGGAGAPVQATFTSRENKRIPRLQWVGADGAVPVEILRPDGTWEAGIGEAALGAASPGQIFQLERYGFARFEDVQPPGGR
ncbi:MAG: glutamate--tRNA ligase, partial [Thermoplasmata archaeon]|nr:glutamate--tRNA ligase [Thermoplasmata archaeon]